MDISWLALEETNSIGTLKKLLFFLLFLKKTFRDFLFLLRKITLIMIINLVKERDEIIPINSLLVLAISFSFLLACKHQKPFILEELNNFDLNSTRLMILYIMLETISLFVNSFFLITFAFYILTAFNIKIIFTLLLNYSFVRLLQRKKFLDKLPKNFSIYLFTSIIFQADTPS